MRGDSEQLLLTTVFNGKALLSEDFQTIKVILAHKTRMTIKLQAFAIIRMTDEERILQLEMQLDDALLKVFDLEKKQKADALVRYELEEMLRSIYYECLRLKESEEKPDAEHLLRNLSENIRQLMEDYKLRL